MSTSPSPRRCTLESLNVRWRASSEMDPNLRDLAISLSRRLRRQTPNAGPMTRMLQNLLIQNWVQAQSSKDLAILTRCSGELLRICKALGMKLPDDSRGAKASVFKPTVARRARARGGQ